jgi:hypothetical protein
MKLMATRGRQELGWSEMEAPLLVSLGISGPDQASSFRLALKLFFVYGEGLL